MPGSSRPTGRRGKGLFHAAAQAADGHGNAGPEIVRPDCPPVCGMGQGEGAEGLVRPSASRRACVPYFQRPVRPVPADVPPCPLRRRDTDASRIAPKASTSARSRLLETSALFRHRRGPGLRTASRNQVRRGHLRDMDVGIADLVFPPFGRAALPKQLSAPLWTTVHRVCRGSYDTGARRRRASICEPPPARSAITARRWRVEPRVKHEEARARLGVQRR